EPRLVRLDEPRPARHVPWLVPELVGPPGDAVVASLDHDLETRRGHDPKQPVTVDAPERLDPPERPSHGPGKGRARGQILPELRAAHGEYHHRHAYAQRALARGTPSVHHEPLHEVLGEGAGPPGVVW